MRGDIQPSAARRRAMASPLGEGVLVRGLVMGRREKGKGKEREDKHATAGAGDDGSAFL